MYGGRKVVGFITMNAYKLMDLENPTAVILHLRRIKPRFQPRTFPFIVSETHTSVLLPSTAQLFLPSKHVRMPASKPWWRLVRELVMMILQKEEESCSRNRSITV